MSIVTGTVETNMLNMFKLHNSTIHSRIITRTHSQYTLFIHTVGKPFCFRKPLWLQVNQCDCGDGLGQTTLAEDNVVTIAKWIMRFCRAINIIEDNGQPKVLKAALNLKAIVVMQSKQNSTNSMKLN